jgi:hypothetical protein
MEFSAEVVENRGEAAGKIAAQTVGPTKFALSWKACAARTVSPSSAAVRGSSRTSITAGRRIFWKRGKKTGWRYGPGGDLDESRTCVARPVS